LRLRLKPFIIFTFWINLKLSCPSFGFPYRTVIGILWFWDGRIVYLRLKEGVDASFWVSVFFTFRSSYFNGEGSSGYFFGKMARLLSSYNYFILVSFSDTSLEWAFFKVSFSKTILLIRLLSSLIHFYFSVN